MAGTSKSPLLDEVVSIPVDNRVVPWMGEKAEQTPAEARMASQGGAQVAGGRGQGAEAAGARGRPALVPAARGHGAEAAGARGRPAQAPGVRSRAAKAAGARGRSAQAPGRGLKRQGPKVQDNVPRKKVNQTVRPTSDERHGGQNNISAVVDPGDLGNTGSAAGAATENFGQRREESL